MKTTGFVSIRFDNIDYASMEDVVKCFPRAGINSVINDDWDGFIGTLPSGVKAAIIINDGATVDGMCVAMDQHFGSQNYLDAVAARVNCDDDGLPGVLPLYVVRVQGLGFIKEVSDETIN